MEKLDNILVGILEGGISEEREISHLSAENVYCALRRQGVKSVRLDINTDDEERIKRILSGKEIDVAFIALHGRFGEDGRIQTILEELKVPYTGSAPYASYLAMDKIASKRAFLKNKIPTPPFFVLERKMLPPEFNLTFPLVVKPHFSGSSIGVGIIKGEDKFDEALEEAFRWGEKVIIEEYIEGRELTVGILEEKPLGVVEIKYQKDFFDFYTKYEDENVFFLAPAKLEGRIYKRVQEVALLAHKTLGCRDFSRVDIRLDKENNPFVLEVNSIPGLTSHSLLPLSAKCCGIKFDELIKRMLILALSRAKSWFYEKKYI